MMTCPSVSATLSRIDNAPWNACNNFHAGLDAAPALTVAQGLLRRERYHFAGDEIRKKAPEELHLPTHAAHEKYMYAPRQASRGFAPGWIVNKNSETGVLAAWCPHTAFCPKRDLDGPYHVLSAHAIPQYHGQYETCVSTSLFEDDECKDDLQDRLWNADATVSIDDVLHKAQQGGKCLSLIHI